MEVCGHVLARRWLARLAGCISGGVRRTAPGISGRFASAEASLLLDLAEDGFLFQLCLGPPDLLQPALAPRHLLGQLVAAKALTRKP